jgi:hypothetical protein
MIVASPFRLLRVIETRVTTRRGCKAGKRGQKASPPKENYQWGALCRRRNLKQKQSVPNVTRTTSRSKALCRIAKATTQTRATSRSVRSYEKRTGHRRFGAPKSRRVKKNLRAALLLAPPREPKLVQKTLDSATAPVHTPGCSGGVRSGPVRGRTTCG